MTGEELIAEGPRVGLGPRLAALVALGTLATTGAIDAAWPLPEKKLLGAEAAKDAAAAAAANMEDGSLFRRAEDLWSRRSRVRAALGPWAALGDLSLGRVVSDKVLLGPDGWLFQRERYAANEHARRHGPEVAADLLAVAARRMRAAGTRLIALPLARKEALCDPRMGPGSVEWAFDESLFSALRDRGIEHVNTLELWRDLEPRDAYRKFDNHWSLPAEVALADRIAASFPELAARDLDVDPTLHLEVAPYRHNMLDMIGLDSDSSAARYVDTREVKRYRLEPEELEAIGEDRAFECDLALAGSSFTEGYSLYGLLVDRFETSLLRFSFSGTQFMAPLALLAQRDRVARAPTTVFYEFPLGFVATAPFKRDRIARAAGKVFEEKAPAAIHVLADLRARILEEPRLEARGRWLRARVPASYFVGTGDGALGLRVAASVDERSEWLLRTSDLDMHVALEPGEPPFVLPLVTGRFHRRAVSLYSLDAAARVADIALDLVSDVDPRGALDMALVQTADGPFRAELGVPCTDRDATAVLAWEGDGVAEVRATLVGVTGAGEPLERSLAITAPAVPFAFVGAGGFAGGRIDRIEVVAPGARGVRFGLKTPGEAR